MDKNEMPRKQVPLIGFVNIGLSFLMPTVCLFFLLGGAWIYYYGTRWVEASFANPGLYMLVTVGISAVVGVINAVGYYRKNYR